MHTRIAILLSLCLVAVIGLAGSSVRVEAQENSLEEEFSKASGEYGVPEKLLKAMGYVNTRWEMPPPVASDYEKGGPSEGSPESRGNYGIMSLYENPSKDTVGKAAELTGLSKEELKTSRKTNIRGGAAVLADIQGEDKPVDLNGWYEAVAEYGGGSVYANQVYETLKSGASAEVSGEKVVLEAQPGANTRPLALQKAAGGYGRATFYGASPYNYTGASRGAAQINKVIIHTAQGSFAGTINWFKDSRAGSSAHYTVRSKDGFVGQSVREKDIAWHAGNWDYNRTSIGIEHEGYVSNPAWYTNAMYRSSARLTAYLCKKYRIPIDRRHIIGHNQVPYPNSHTDPGRYWNWTKYMSLVKSYAGGTRKAEYVQTVDNRTPGRFAASRIWKSSNYSSQSYGRNYRYVVPGARLRPAYFKVRTPKRGKYQIYGRWPANEGYNRRAVFRIRTAGGIKYRAVNQEKNGGRWVSLGTYNMAAGDGWKVQISNRSSTGKDYIIADAVRIVRWSN